MTPRREVKSPNSTLSAGGTPRRTQSLDDHDNTFRNRSSSHHGHILFGSTEIPEERQVYTEIYMYIYSIKID